MSELHKFLFDGLPVRGMIVRLTGAWTELLARRAGNTETGAYPAPVSELLGEMAAAAVLMQSNIKFNGALVLQIFGDGPVKLAVAEFVEDEQTLQLLQGMGVDMVQGYHLDKPRADHPGLHGDGRAGIAPA